MKQLFSFLISSLFLFACNNADESVETQAGNSSVIGCYHPKTNDKDWYSSGKKAPRLPGLTGIDFAITTNNKEAQDYFNQGMMLAYGFNHAEAARSFYEATRLDSSCAMAYWGYAYVLGPNYNGGMEEDNFQRAYEAAGKAQSLSASCNAREKALIHALSSRYAADPPADRGPLDRAYSAAMKKVYDQFPSDPDMGALYAESLMDLHPWDLYEKETKQPKAWTPEIVAVLEHLMKMHPVHPGAHHFYVHALEASATPEKALPSAYLLDSLVPGSGHLVHMPSHIYINTGDYHLGSLSNIRAVAVDSIYTTACHAQGVYPLAYYPHNYHFLTATAALEGNSKLSWSAARELQAHTAKEIMEQPGWGTLQHYYTIPYYIAVKFGMWDSILAIPSPGENLVYPNAILHYAKGMAWLGKKDLPAARKEWDSLNHLAGDTSLQELTIWGINTTADLVQIAVKILEAEIAKKEHRYETAVALLTAAVTIEDGLNYNEPPDWFFSVRHHLGAVMLRAGMYGAAEKIYQEDLKTWKKNGWALLGLQKAYAARNKTAEAARAKAEFEEAWKYADFELASSSPIPD